MSIPSLSVDPFDEAFLGDPYRHHAAIRDAGPIVWLPAIGAYGAARYAGVKAILEDPETFVSGRGVGLADFAREIPWRPPSLLLEADPPLHDKTRGLMNKVVSLSSLRAMRGEWQEKAVGLIDELTVRQRFDAVIDLAEEFPLRVFPEMIGLMDEGRENLIPYGTATFNAFGSRNAVFEAGNAKAAGAIAWVSEACKRRNLKPGGWGMSVYEAADKGLCSEDDAERLVRSFLSAGVDTTVNGIGNMLLAFAENPTEWAKLRAEPKLAVRAFEESLRFDGTVQTFFRTTARDTMIDDMAIPEGSKILLFFAAANRDPRRWDAPETFDIERQTSGHLGFGFGIHQCLGQMMARMEAEILLEAMIRRFRTISLTGTPIRRINNTLHALANLPVEIQE